MYKKITLTTYDGKEKDVEFLANAATPLRYKQIFGGDLIQKFVDAKKEKNGETTYNIDFLGELAFLMAMQAKKKSDDSISLEKLSMDNYLDWLEDFGGMAIEDKAEEIIGVYIGNTKTDSEAKKNADKPKEK